ncbi:MAG TPA: VOC family protein [Bryobacteraceae bacterium]|nr:VOC family protein [Bryobacteraceae bacterium]
MPKPSRYDQLDQAIQALLARRSAGPAAPGTMAPLLEIASGLLDLPRENFKARLKSELERRSSMATTATHAEATPVRQTATARLRVKNAAAAIDFYKKAFGARELMRFTAHGEIPHAELAIGNSTIMLGEEALDYGFPGPLALGGSPVTIQLSVDDVDAAFAQAVAAGAKVVWPLQDQFYGNREGSVADPFGYTWGLSTRKREMSVEEMQRSFEAMEQEAGAQRRSPIPEGYHTITPYLVAKDAAGLLDFLKQTFAAEETGRAIGSAGGIHAGVRIGDSMLMAGGGGPGLSWRGENQPMALHVYVEDTDAAYQRALAAGATSIQPPEDHDYGERGASVKDRAGNHWYIATYKGAKYIPQGLRTVTPYLHPLRAEPVLNFLQRAFGAAQVKKYASPDGVIHHARITVGDSVLEMGEAQGPYQPMPSMFYLYVPDVDNMYRRALNAGGTSIDEPADQPYGDRRAGVKDPFGNQWNIATRIRDTAQ